MGSTLSGGGAPLRSVARDAHATRCAAPPRIGQRRRLLPEAGHRCVHATASAAGHLISACDIRSPRPTRSSRCARPRWPSLRTSGACSASAHHRAGHVASSPSRQGHHRRAGPRHWSGQRRRARCRRRGRRCPALALEIRRTPARRRGTKAVLQAATVDVPGLEYVATWNAGMLGSDTSPSDAGVPREAPTQIHR